MSGKKSNPPRSAIWLLQHACPGSDNEALTGDLIERFREGRSRGWFWKQILIAIAVGVLSEIPRHWPHFCYAIAGTAMPMFLGKSVLGVRSVVHWYALRWPWSQLVFEWTPQALLTLAALPVLGAVLAINGAFRWVCLLRTGMISLALITLVHHLPDAFPWLERPMPDNPHLRTLIVEPVFVIFSAFLVSAWLGCRLPRRAAQLERPVS